MGLPVTEKIVEHREESLFRGVPRLHQIVVKLDIVDRPDRDFGVGIGRQQHPLGYRKERYD